MPSNALEIQLLGDVTDYGRALRQAQRETDELASKIVDSFANASGSIEGLIDEAGKMASTCIDVAAKSETLSITLETMSGSSTRAAEQMEQFGAFADKFHLPIEQVEQMGTRIAVMGGDFAKVAPLAATLAQVLGQDLDSTARTVTQAFAGQTRGLSQLVRGLGLTREQLKSAGFEMDEHGKIVSKVTGDIEANADALQKLVQARFPDELAKQAEDLGKAWVPAQNAIKELEGALGKVLAPSVKITAAVIGDLLGYVAQFKDRAADVVAVASAMQAGMVAIASGGALAGPALLEIFNLTSPIIEADEKLVTSTERLARWLHEERESLVAVSGALKMMGGDTKAAADATADYYRAHNLTNVDATKQIIALEKEQQKAEADGNKEQVKNLGAVIETLRLVRNELGSVAGARKEAADKAAQAEKEAEAKAAAAYKDFEEQKQAHVYETKAAELAALDAALALQKKGSDEEKKLLLERIQLAREAAKEVQTNAEKAAELQKKLAESAKQSGEVELGILKDKLSHGEATLAQYDAQIKKVEQLALAQIAAEAAREKIGKSAVEQTAIDEAARVKAMEATHKAESQMRDAKRQQMEKELELQSRLAGAAKKVADVDLVGLKDRYEHGQATLAQLEAQIKKVQELEAAEIRAQAAREGAGKSPEEQTALKKSADASVDAAKKKSVQEIGDLEREQQKRDADAALSQMETAEKLRKIREEDAHQQFEDTKTNSQAWLEAAQRRMDGEKAVLEARQAQERVGKQGAELDALRKKQEEEILELKRQQRSELEKITDEIKKQLALQGLLDNRTASGDIKGSSLTRDKDGNIIDKGDGGDYTKAIDAAQQQSGNSTNQAARHAADSAADQADINKINGGGGQTGPGAPGGPAAAAAGSIDAGLLAHAEKQTAALDGLLGIAKQMLQNAGGSKSRQSDAWDDSTNPNKLPGFDGL